MANEPVKPTPKLNEALLQGAIMADAVGTVTLLEIGPVAAPLGYLAVAGRPRKPFALRVDAGTGYELATPLYVVSVAKVR